MSTFIVLTATERLRIEADGVMWSYDGLSVAFQRSVPDKVALGGSYFETFAIFPVHAVRAAFLESEMGRVVDTAEKPLKFELPFDVDKRAVG